MSSKPAGVRALMAQWLNGLVSPNPTPSCERIGDFGGSPPEEAKVVSDEGDLIRIDSIWTGSRVSNAALG